jgi:hypothetical protein
MTDTINLRLGYIEMDVHTHHRIHLSVRSFVPREINGKAFAAVGADLWLDSTRFQAVGAGAMLPKVLVEALRSTYVEPFKRLAATAEQLTAALDARLLAAGIMAPCRRIGVVVDPATRYNDWPSLEIGGVGARTAIFRLYPDGLRLDLPYRPTPMPTALPGQALHPSTAKAISRWESTWSDVPAERIRRLMNKDVEAGLRSFAAVAAKILPTKVVV